MMISEARREIDKLDAEIARLFEKRMDVVACIADYKKKYALEIVDLAREQEIVDQVKQQLHSRYESQLVEFFECIINITRNYQRDYYDN